MKFEYLFCGVIDFPHHSIDGGVNLMKSFTCAYFCPSQRHANSVFTFGKAQPRRQIARYFCCAAAVVFGLHSQIAMAADLPVQKGPLVYAPPPVAVFDWTGFYGGLNGGYGLDYFPLRSTVTFPSGASVTGYSGLDERGALFGGQIGFNYQFTNLPLIGHAVVGVEANSDWADIAGSTQINTAFGPMTFGTAVRNSVRCADAWAIISAASCSI